MAKLSSLKVFYILSWKANDEQPLEFFRSRIEQYLRTFPYRSLKSDGFKSSPEFSYIFYVKH